MRFGHGGWLRAIRMVGGCCVIAACGATSPTAPTSPAAPSVPTSPPIATAVVVDLTVLGLSVAYIGQSVQLSASALLSNGPAQDVTAQSAWQSSNVGVATVSSAGQLTAVGLGVVDIRATYQTVSGTLSVSVNPVASETPSYSTSRPLMEQVSGTGPLYVTARATVPNAALVAAGSMLRSMLLNRFDVGATMRNAGALTAVFGRSETSCDLPYFAHLQGTSSCTSGGLGGTPGNPVTGCAERNLLRHSDDPFRRGRPDGENVCVHELAHTIMNVGLSSDVRALVRARFTAAVVEGIWAGDFAMQNADEFFAEMSQSYFCANPDVPAFLHTHGINCASRLRAYDAATFALIDGIYRGAADLR